MHSLRGVLLALSLVSSVFSGEFTGAVVSVRDGDTLEVVHNNRAEPIRLRGIDCPEKGQAFGQKATEVASALVFGKDVRLETYGRDGYKRTLADVFLPDGTNVNRELVKAGWCWWYREYAPADHTLYLLEFKARHARLGFWSDEHPMPPWVFRKLKRGVPSDFRDWTDFDTEGDSPLTIID